MVRSFLMAKTPPDGGEDERLTSFLDDVFEREVDDSPLLQGQLGRRTGRYGEWDNFSDAHEQDIVNRVRRDLEHLESRFDYDRLSDDLRLSYDVFKFNAQQRLSNFQFRYHDYVVTQHISRISGLPNVLQNFHQINGTEDANAYVSRLVKLEEVMSQVVSRLQTRADMGIIAPSLSFSYVIDDARAIISGSPMEPSPNDNPLFADFRTKLEKLPASNQIKASLLEQAAAALVGPVRRGYQSFITKLQELRAKTQRNDGAWSLPDGATYYDNRIKNFTTLDMTAEEVHQTGLDEVARIQNEMIAIKEQVAFKGSLQAFFKFVREDPENYYPDGEAGRQLFLAEARTQIDSIYQTVHRYFNRVPKADLEVRRVESWRENTGGIAFYSRASSDGSRPGIYYANLRDMRSVQKYVFTAITYHESVPGHHFQNAIAQELTDLPAFRKNGSYSAFGEGWALYAEQLAKEMGFYQDPLRNFGRLQNELWRAARLVIDTGLHVKKWTLEDGVRYFQDNTPLSDGDIKTEVERYLVVPGQALSYTIGLLKMLELRSKAQRELGGKFDIRTFHNSVLGSGALPLPILERVIDDYIASKRIQS